MPTLLWDLRNRLDFFLRQSIRFQAPIREVRPVDLKLAEETASFLLAFNWPVPGPRPCRVLDVGAKNFFLALAADRFEPIWGKDFELHGIELDAYRRYPNLRARADYGRYYAAQSSRGTYHAMDFLAWEAPADIILLLHPFVLPRSVLAWGLPLRFLQPSQLVGHAWHLLRPGGLLLTSSPTQSELTSLNDLTSKLDGCTEIETKKWSPCPETAQQTWRFGTLFRKPV